MHHNWHECWRHGPSQNTKINAHWQRPRQHAVHSESLHGKGKEVQNIAVDVARKQPTFIMGSDTTQKLADGKLTDHWKNRIHAASHMAPLRFDTGGGGRDNPEATLDAGHFAHIAEHKSQIEDSNSRSCRIGCADRQVHSTCQSLSTSPTAYQLGT